MPRRRADVPTTEVWVVVCARDDLEPTIGVAALVKGHQVALFRLVDDDVLAVSNRDPHERTQSIARGVLLDEDVQVRLVTLPQRRSFDLRTGESMDDSHASLQTYPVRIVDGNVEVCVRVRAA